MPQIVPPKCAKSNPDRLFFCQEAIEKAFLSITYDAQAVGWSRYEVAEALLSLAEQNWSEVEATTNPEDGPAARDTTLGSFFYPPDVFASARRPNDEVPSLAAGSIGSAEPPTSRSATGLRVISIVCVGLIAVVLLGLVAAGLQ